MPLHGCRTRKQGETLRSRGSALRDSDDQDFTGTAVSDASAAPSRSEMNRRRQFDAFRSRRFDSPNLSVFTLDRDMCGTVGVSEPNFRSGFGRTCDEIAIKLCRALSCRYPVDSIAVWPVRYGNVTNRRSASRRHGRSTEADGKATQAWEGDNHRCIPPDIASHASVIACADFNISKACQDRENFQQLRRWLPDKLQVRQRPLEWMLLVEWSFLANVQKRGQLQDLLGMH